MKTMTKAEVLEVLTEASKHCAAYDHELLQARAAVSEVFSDYGRTKQQLNAMGVSDERMRGHISTGMDVFATRTGKEITALRAEVERLNAKLALLMEYNGEPT